MICRCETITEGEILAALHSEVPANTIDGVKRRAGAGTGRCQGGFCGPRVLGRQQGRQLLADLFVDASDAIGCHCTHSPFVKGGAGETPAPRLISSVTEESPPW